jgi:hypothetical protein
MEQSMDFLQSIFTIRVPKRMINKNKIAKDYLDFYYIYYFMIIGD